MLRILRPHFLIALAWAFASTNGSSARPEDINLNFEDFYELETVTIVGEAIPITIFARSGGDRRYATRFAHNVVEVAYDTLQGSPGPGLVIIGQSGEPHPIRLLESFMEKARRDGASPELARIADELDEAVGKWREKIDFDVDSDQSEEDFPIDVNQLIDAFPIPLPQLAAKLYLVAWKEDFDPERVDLRFDKLTAEELREQEFEEFQWVFYLPPKNSLNKVIKEILPVAFKEADLGPVKRMLARAAIAAFKPLIKDAMEGVRKGVLYWAVLSANESAFNEGDIELLAGKYIESQMPRGKIIGGDKKERALEFTRKQKEENAAYAKDPFVALEPIDDFDPAHFTRFLGRYGDEGHRNKRFFTENESYFWQEGDDDPVEYLPAGGLFFVSTDKDITLEFIPGETPSFSRVELRKGRFRHTFARLPEAEIPQDE